MKEENHAKQGKGAEKTKPEKQNETSTGVTQGGQATLAVWPSDYQQCISLYRTGLRHQVRDGVLTTW